MPKNILIFSDGSGQAGGLTPDQNISNIYKLYRATRCGPENNVDPSRQLTFYDPGLGSQPDSGLFFVTRGYRWLHDIVSQATGLGITTNIFDCYAALLRMWQPGDRIFLFGLKRTVFFAKIIKIWPHVAERRRRARTGAVMQRRSARTCCRAGKDCRVARYAESRIRRWRFHGGC
jgi:uncharacterized protein (DUF2235 family)